MNLETEDRRHNFTQREKEKRAAITFNEAIPFVDVNKLGIKLEIPVGNKSMIFTQVFIIFLGA